MEPNHPSTPISALNAEQIADAAARRAVEAMAKEGERDKLPIPELRRNAVDLARRLREFQPRYLEASYGLHFSQFEPTRMGLPKADLDKAFTQYTTTQLSLSHAELSEFGPLRAEANNMRRDLLDALHEKFDPPNILTNPRDRVV